MLRETEAKLAFVKSLQVDKDLFQPFSLRRREKAPGPNLASEFVLNFPRLILVILVTRQQGEAGAAPEEGAEARAGEETGQEREEKQEWKKERKQDQEQEQERSRSGKGAGARAIGGAGGRAVEEQEKERRRSRS